MVLCLWVVNGLLQTLSNVGIVKGVIVGRKQVWRVVGRVESVKMVVVASLVRGSREILTARFSLCASY
jgi:hypothetical protein